MINADEKLKVVFAGKKQISMFELAKIVNNHVKEFLCGIKRRKSEGKPNGLRFFCTKIKSYQLPRALASGILMANKDWALAQK